MAASEMAASEMAASEMAASEMVASEMAASEMVASKMKEVVRVNWNRCIWGVPWSLKWTELHGIAVHADVDAFTVEDPECAQQLEETYRVEQVHANVYRFYQLCAYLHGTRKKIIKFLDAVASGGDDRRFIEVETSVPPADDNYCRPHLAGQHPNSLFSSAGAAMWPCGKNAGLTLRTTADAAPWLTPGNHNDVRLAAWDVVTHARILGLAERTTTLDVDAFPKRRMFDFEVKHAPPGLPRTMTV